MSYGEYLDDWYGTRLLGWLSVTMSTSATIMWLVSPETRPIDSPLVALVAFSPAAYLGLSWMAWSAMAQAQHRRFGWPPLERFRLRVRADMARHRAAAGLALLGQDYIDAV